MGKVSDITNGRKQDVSERADVRMASSVLYDEICKLSARDARDGTAFGLTVETIRDMVKSHREHWRRRGVPFPRLVVLDFPITGAIELLRDDIDNRSCQALVLTLATKYPNMTTHEMVVGISKGFPQYRPESQTPVNFELRRGARIADRFAQ